MALAIVLFVCVPVFVVSFLLSSLFGWEAVAARKPDVSLFRASLFHNLFNDPSLYTEEGQVARHRFIACYLICGYAMATILITATLAKWLANP